MKSPDALARCSCARMQIGDSRNWNPDCAVHGVSTEWYRSDEQVERRRVQSERLRDLQRQARDARRKAQA